MGIFIYFFFMTMDGRYCRKCRSNFWQMAMDNGYAGAFSGDRHFVVGA
jgi:hypothetical protein